ncbi:MAG: FkbM family methyltransferase [Gammaproteobacteria bacterium]
MKIKKNLAVWLAWMQERALSGLEQGEIETIARHVAEQVHDPFHPLVAYAHALHEKATTIPNRFSENGERALLDRVSALDVRSAFDVGANVGTWSTHALKVFPKADVHAFEVVPATFETLSERLGEDRRVHLHPFGLSDESGHVTVSVYPSNLLASMFALEGQDHAVGKIECKVERGADAAAAEGLRHIDILKIDVEGAEGRVLSGFEPMLTEARVRLVQFEYNRGAILGGFLLKHAYEFFCPRGYRLGKLTPLGVRFHPYQFAHEDFIGPNYVACREGDEEMIAAVRCPD